MTIRQQNNSTGKGKVRDFFRGKTWKNILTFFFFLLIAFGFWVLQYLQQQFEADVVVPLKYKNVPAQISLDPGLPQEINLRVAGKGTVLLNFTLNQKISSIDIDLKKLNPEKSYYSISGVALEKEIEKYLPASTSLVSCNPDKIEIKYNPQRKKTIPVKIVGSILPKAGFMFEDSIHLEPQEVTVYGSEIVLDTLEAIYTKSVNMNDLQAHFDKKVELIFPEGITSDKKTVMLSADIEGYTEKVFKLPVICENAPDDYVVRLFPSIIEFTCQVPLSKYTTLTENDFKLYVEYKELIDNKESSVPVKVSLTAKWVKHYRLSPENIEFLIEKRAGK